MPKGFKGFQKGHGRFRTDESYEIASFKISQAMKGHPQFNTGRTHFKKGIPNNVLEKNPMWKGGQKTNKDGYFMILAHGNPNANSRGYILEHRLVMQKLIGRPLKKNESVHHKNGIKNDNRPENLQLMSKLIHCGEIICPFCKKQFLIR